MTATSACVATAPTPDRFAMNVPATDAVLRAVASEPNTTFAPSLLVGYSGGLDSTVLLHALAKAQGGRVRAIHIHHGLHPDADAWATHCRQICDALGVSLVTVKVDVVDIDAGPEAAARAARHAAFETHLREGEWLTLAHHRDDQAETFLLRALRGSGPDGLSAMRPWRRFGAGCLWRPLLGLPRDTLMAYAEANELAWIEDPSNTSSVFDRNYLRNNVMPMLQKRWPQVDAAFARAALLQQQARVVLQANDDDFDVTTSPLQLESLRALPPMQRARGFRAWASHHALPPVPTRVVEWLETELAKPPRDGASECHWAGTLLRRWRDALYLPDPITPLPMDLDIEWDGRDELALPNGLVWRLSGTSALQTPTRVRARLGGERIELAKRQHRHLLKHLWQEQGVPPWRRNAIPLMFRADGVLLAAGDLHSALLDAWLDANHGTLTLINPARD